MNIKSNSIVGVDGTSAVELANGYSVGSLDLQGGVVFSGISTIGIVSSTSINVSGVVTATSFVGNGSFLSGISTITKSRVIGLKYIFADPPLRA